MFVRMLKLPEAERRRYDVSSLRVAIHAAAPCPIPVKQQMIAWWGPVLYEYYAGTEGNGFTSISSQEWLAHPGSVGRPLNAKLRILDDEGHELPTGTPGGIYFEGGGSFEYHNAPEKTAGSRTPQGWITLGDIGYVDAEGYLYLTDRKANMIISGGVNIYPQEAENLLVTHPKVADVAVFGDPERRLRRRGEGGRAAGRHGRRRARARARADRLLPEPAREAEVSAQHRFRSRAAAASHGQALQAAAARSLLGPARLADRVRRAT